jgi:hypothetical protein
MSNTVRLKQRLERPVIFFSENVTNADMKLAKEVHAGLVAQGLAKDQIVLVHRDATYTGQPTGAFISVADKDKAVFRFETVNGNVGRHLGLLATKRRLDEGEQVVVKL